jgi:predicted transcriptional regulator
MSMGEIIAAVQADHPDIAWKYKTYHSYLRVMLEKELIGSESLSLREKRYVPRISEEEALSAESDTLLARITSRSLSRMMAMMAQRGGLTADERQELARLFVRLSAEEEEHDD